MQKTLQVDSHMRFFLKLLLSTLNSFIVLEIEAIPLENAHVFFWTTKE